jgi:3-oxoisoapionate kinase
MIQEELMIGFYGDDFTGSTDVMEALSFNGIPTALFLQPPDPDDIRNFRLKNSHVSSDQKLKAYGIAGISRSLTPQEMNSELPSVFEKMARIPTRYFHYKVCSTFDSSPHIGNIGHAVEIALRYFPTTFVPLIVGIPLLNRFCVFGNLFARVDDLTYRIDRHPTMSRHPVTPMDEADLRRHLGKQTKREIHLIDVMNLDDLKVCKKLYKKLSNQGGYILFDVLTKHHLQQIGTTLEEGRKNPQQLVVGSSGVEYALCSHWQQSGLANKSAVPLSTKQANRYIVIAGSCSPGTAKQIQHGLSLGYSGIRMDSEKLFDNSAQEVSRCTEACLNVLSDGGVPMLFSAMGPDDPCIQATRDKLKQSETRGDSIGSRLGGAQGEVLKNIIDQTGKLRVTVAGGDTSGFVTKALGIHALEVLVPIAPGAPLCVAHAKDEKYDGLEMSLKGGQNGNYQYFEFVQLGKATYEQ